MDGNFRLECLQSKKLSLWQLKPQMSSSSLGRLFATLAAAFAVPALAQQPVSDAEQTRRQMQQQEQAQSRVIHAPDVFTPTDTRADRLVIPDEKPCFDIREIELLGAENFRGLEQEVRRFLGLCLGAQGLRVLQDHLTRQLIEKGFVTSRVLIPEQNLADGRLTVQVIPGRIGKIRDQGKSAGFARMAFPPVEGELLNQRDLDQALENIRRLGGQQQVEFDLVPGASLGETDIVVKHPESKSWRGMLTLDNSGAKSTGEYQLGAILSVDSPLHLYDSLVLTLNRNANLRTASHGSSSSSINWNVPFGYWSFILGASQSKYKQTIAGFGGNIEYSGHSYGYEAGLAYVPYRTTDAKGTAQFKLTRRVSRSRIDDTEIDVQYRNVTGFEAGFSHRQYLGASVIDAGIALRGSLPSHSDAPGLIVGAPGWDGRYRIQSLYASLSMPMELLGERLRYYGQLRGQRATTLLPAHEFFSIGNRYTVRGFDGEVTLTAENGWLLRNEVAWQIGNGSHQAYVGLDTGRVGGSSAGFLLGQSLTGAALGVRGNQAGINYDISLGWPLKKPEGFKAQHPVIAASIAVEF